MAKVQLGDVVFDPVEPTDFRLSIEGDSGGGKTNTMAVFLEELADTNIPTLVIESLGLLTTVRAVDDNMIVVGGSDADGVDLVVPIDQVGRVAEMVIDDGLKVLLDISTYRDPENPDAMIGHKAAARAINRLNDRAGERLRSEHHERRKVLLVVDEVHKLAPETNSPFPSDENTDLSKAALVQVSLEGGNKGINLITSWQRRALTVKSVTTQPDNRVVHKLNSKDRKEVCDELAMETEENAALDTGEVFIRGEFTDGETVGPTKVRLRDSPDPRSAEFTLPEKPPDLEAAINDIQAEVEEEAKADRERKDELERLRDRNDRLEDRVAELESEREIFNDIREAIQRAAETGGTTAEIAESVADIEELERIKTERDDLLDRVDELEATIEDLRETATDRTDRIEELQAELTEYEDLDRRMDDILDHARSIVTATGRADLDTMDTIDAMEDLRAELEETEEELADVREERDRLQDRIEEVKSRETAPETVIDRERAEYRDFIEYHDEETDQSPVKKAIADAKSEDRVTPRYVNRIIVNLVRKGGPVTYTELKEDLGVKTTSDISKAKTALESRGVVIETELDGETAVDLNLDGIEEIIRKIERSKEADRIEKELSL